MQDSAKFQQILNLYKISDLLIPKTPQFETLTFTSVGPQNHFYLLVAPLSSDFFKLYILHFHIQPHHKSQGPLLKFFKINECGHHPNFQGWILECGDPEFINFDTTPTPLQAGNFVTDSTLTQLHSDFPNLFLLT